MTVESILESTYDELIEQLNKFNHNAYNVLDSSPGFGKGYYIANKINNDQFQSVKEQIQELEELLNRIFEANGLNIQNKEIYLFSGGGVPLNQAFNSVLPWMISRSARHSPDKVIQELKSWFDSETHRLLTVIPFACDYRFPPDEIHNFKVDDLDLSICSLDTMKDNRINRICFQFAHPEGRVHTASSQISLLFSSIHLPKLLEETNTDSKQPRVNAMRELPYLIKIFGIIENIKILKFNTFEHLAPEVPFGGLSYRQDFEALSGEIRPNFQKELKALNTINWQRFEQACKSYLTFNNEQKPKLITIIDRLNLLKLHVDNSYDSSTRQAIASPSVDGWIDLRIVLELLLNDKKTTELLKTVSTRGAILSCPVNDLDSMSIRLKEIKKIYDHSSKAIHSGVTAQKLDDFNKGVEICSKLIELYLQKGKFPNFRVLDLSRDINKAFE